MEVLKAAEGLLGSDGLEVTKRIGLMGEGRDCMQRVRASSAVSSCAKPVCGRRNCVCYAIMPASCAGGQRRLAALLHVDGATTLLAGWRMQGVPAGHLPRRSGMGVPGAGWLRAAAAILHAAARKQPEARGESAGQGRHGDADAATCGVLCAQPASGGMGGQGCRSLGTHGMTARGACTAVCFAGSLGSRTSAGACRVASCRSSWVCVCHAARAPLW